ncbi:MAG: nucleotidyltransferase domain-containing protein [Planctomycetes bacterium]|nr:nucleotidyltransferase domain-containing protein [Planctomycetota bacterium]
MNAVAFSEHELAMIRAVLRRHPRVTAGILFGSRAKGTHSERSDVDLAVVGDVTALEAEAIAGDLEELPLPYRFDVQAVARITHRPLRDHIDRVGLCIYRAA